MISRGVKNWPPSLPLLAHLEQQALVHLREREDMRVVDVARADFMHLVQHVAEVAFGVDAPALDAAT